MSPINWLKQTFGKVNDWWQQNVSTPIHKGIGWLNQSVIQPGAKVLRDVPVIGGIADGVGTIGNAAENIAATNAGKRPGNFGTNLSELGNIVKGGAQIYNSSKRVRVA